MGSIPTPTAKQESDVKIAEVMDELGKYLDAMGSDEWSESRCMLMEVMQCSEYLSKEVVAATEKELRESLEWCAETFEMVTLTKTTVENFKSVKRRDEDDD